MSSPPVRPRSTNSLIIVQSGPTRLLLGAGLVLVLLTVYLAALASTRWNSLVPGLFVDPYGTVSNVGWPGWNGYRRGLAFPTRILSVEGQDIHSRPPVFPAAVIEETCERLERLGHTSLQVVVSAPGSQRETLTLQIERLSPIAWLVLFASYALLAWIWLAAAGFSYRVRPDSPSVAAFARFAALNALLLLLTFDFHTTRKLVPLFTIGYCLLPAVVLEMGMRFPDDLEVVRNHPYLVWLPRFFGMALLTFVFLLSYRGGEAGSFGASCIGASIVCLVLVMGIRSYLAEGRRRTQLILALSLWVPVYLAVALTLLVSPQRVGPYVFFAAVPLTVFGTLGVTYALVRYDLWDGRVHMRRSTLRTLITVVLALVSGLGGAIFGLSLQVLKPEWLQTVLIFAAWALALPGYRAFAAWLDGKLFPAEVLYRPTVEQLSLRFTDLASRQAVAEAVESTVRQWLSCDRVRFVLLPPPPPERSAEDSGQMMRSLPPVAAMAVLAIHRGDGSVSNLGNPPSSVGLSASLPEPPEWRRVRHAARKAGIEGILQEQAASLCSGEVVRPPPGFAGSLSGKAAVTVIPARFRDQVVGLLSVWARQSAQFLTSEDEVLLRTIANQAALALACANAYEEVEALRRAQEAAFREEKEAALGAFAAEIAHEIRIPINYFRILLDGYGSWVRDGLPPDAENVEIGREEIDRLERMAGNLRRIGTPKVLDRQTVGLRQLVEHVLLLLRDRAKGRNIEVEIDPLLDVNADRDALTQILVNLVGNALDACPTPGRLGLSCEYLPDGRQRLVVWDTGPGLLADVGKLFQPLFTTKKTGTGLGLPITRRLVRAHGWEIGAQRRGERTCFEVVIPKEEWHCRPVIPDDAQFESNPLK